VRETNYRLSTPRVSTTRTTVVEEIPTSPTQPGVSARCTSLLGSSAPSTTIWECTITAPLPAALYTQLHTVVVTTSDRGLASSWRKTSSWRARITLTQSTLKSQDMWEITRSKWTRDWAHPKILNRALETNPRTSDAVLSIQSSKCSNVRGAVRELIWATIRSIQIDEHTQK